MKFKELLMMFFLNNRDFLEEEIEKLQSRLRHRKAETGDGLRLELAIERLATFNAIVNAVTALMKMKSTDEVENIKYVYLDVDYLKRSIERDRERIKRVP